MHSHPKSYITTLNTIMCPEAYVKKPYDVNESEAEYEIIEADRVQNTLLIGAIVIGSILFFIAIILTFTSCTITMSNITTHGSANDVGSDTITPTDDISADIPISLEK